MNAMRKQTEFTVNITLQGGGTEALTIVADSKEIAAAKIAEQYPGSTLNWIL